MKIEQIKLEDIKPYQRNPRVNDGVIEDLIRSIDKFGFNVPLVLDKHKVIITGHSRYKALTKMGKKEAPCVISDMDELKAKEYRIVDNRLSEKSSWDFENLQSELRELETAVGFTDEELQDLLNVTDTDEVTDDMIAEMSDNLDAKFNKIAEDDANRKVQLMCPHCLKEFTVNKGDVQ